MLFQTPEFALLFVVTLAAFYLAAPRYRLWILGVSSLAFYAASGLLDFGLLVATIVVSYLLAKQIRPDGSRWPIVVATILLLNSLAYFKYGEFAYQNLRDWTGGAAWAERPDFLATILPLGISFYTFQIIGYLIDLRAGRAEQSRSLLEFTVYVTFFAQLVAGPIMRARDYFPQLRLLGGAQPDQVRSGVLLILVGLFKKVVLADELAERVDPMFAASSYSQPEAWVAAALFAFQIYFDFSGYVDIALGLGRTFGINLTENFRTPYLSSNPSEFWQRWHITLSNWFRDYLYIPLGGNRAGRLRELFNLLFVMGLAGLWHGAGWTFVLWGLIHGSFLAAQRFIPTATIRGFLPVPSHFRDATFRLLSIALFFNLTVLAWIPFRAPDFATTRDMYVAIFTFSGFSDWFTVAPWVVAVVGFLLLHWVERVAKEEGGFPVRFWGFVPAFARGTVYASALLLVVAFSGEQQTFIYFRF